MANYMAEVAKILGVELGERFKIINVGANKSISEYDYYFTDKDIEIDNEGRACSGEYLLIHLIYGDFAIKHKPYKPNRGETYWYVEKDGNICEREWHSCRYMVDHLNRYKLGNCYRTKEEAEANRDKWVKFYASDEVLEV